LRSVVLRELKLFRQPLNRYCKGMRLAVRCQLQQWEHQSLKIWNRHVEYLGLDKQCRGGLDYKRKLFRKIKTERQSHGGGGPTGLGFWCGWHGSKRNREIEIQARQNAAVIACDATGKSESGCSVKRTEHGHLQGARTSAPF
jgi:hypothetical protein